MKKNNLFSFIIFILKSFFFFSAYSFFLLLRFLVVVVRSGFFSGCVLEKVGDNNMCVCLCFTFLLFSWFFLKKKEEEKYKNIKKKTICYRDYISVSLHIKKKIKKKVIKRILLVIHNNWANRISLCAGDGTFKFLPYQLWW